jgi:hypothetical protein
MPMVKFSVSALGNEIEPSIESFIKANISATENDSTTPQDGAKMIAHAIAYGIAKAFGSASFQSALLAGVATPGGGPVGQLIGTTLTPLTKEV